MGSVLSFLPIIVTLFSSLSILGIPDTWRVAFIMDKPLRKFGLSGRSFVPMLMGFGVVPRNYGDAHTRVRARPPHDDYADAVYELLGKDTDICGVWRGIFTPRRHCNDRTVA